MQLKRFHAVIEAEIQFTKHELDELINLSRGHYDYACSAAGVEGVHGGFLAGFRKQLGDEKSITVQMTRRQLDILAKIAEAENGFAMIGGMPIRGDLGEKLHNIMEQMRNYSQTLDRASRPNPISL